MATTYRHRVLDSTTTTGTGTITLAGSPPTGFQGFSAFTNGDTVEFTITDDSGNWEVARGVYASAGPTLTRAAILASSNAGSAVNFGAGTKRVFATVEPALFLKADTADVLTAGFAATPFSAGTKSTGTFTPDEASGNFQYATNGGAHTLAPPTNSGSLVLLYANNASAGTITTSGFTMVTGDDFTTTNGHEFMLYVTKHNNGVGFSHLHVVALQ